MIFTRAIQSSTAPLVKEFRLSGVFRPTQAGVGCINCSSNKLPRLEAQVAEIPKACIQASYKRKVAQSSIECQRQPNGDWKYKKRSARSREGPCFDDTTVDYVHFVTNKVISCFQGLELKKGEQESIDPKLLYSKINNESGFNFTYSYNGGVGAGQLTSSAVQEMNVLDTRRTGGRVVPGGGRFILDSILESKKPACQSLKSVIQNDKKFKYSSPRSINCEWVSLETGYARNLIYSVGFFSYLKHEIIGKELKKRAPSVYKDTELLNLLTLVAYGPAGTNRALTLIRTLGMGSNPRSNDAIKQALRKETYVAATASKLKEVKKIAGDSCRLL